MDEDDVRLLRYDGKPVADRILPLRAALDDTPGSKSLDVTEKPFDRLYLIGTDGNNQFTDSRNLGKSQQRPQQHRLSRKG